MNKGCNRIPFNQNFTNKGWGGPELYQTEIENVNQAGRVRASNHLLEFLSKGLKEARETPWYSSCSLSWEVLSSHRAWKDPVWGISRYLSTHGSCRFKKKSFLLEGRTCGRVPGRGVGGKIKSPAGRNGSRMKVAGTGEKVRFWNSGGESSLGGGCRSTAPLYSKNRKRQN